MYVSMEFLVPVEDLSVMDSSLVYMSLPSPF